MALCLLSGVRGARGRSVSSGVRSGAGRRRQWSHGTCGERQWGCGGGRTPARAPRRARRGGRLQVRGAEGGDAQGARAQRRAGAGVRRGGGGPRAAHSEDLLLLLLLGVRVAVPADGRVLQADGHERGPVRPADRHAALRRVPVSTLLGLAGGPLAQGAHAAAGLAGRLDRVHAAAELGAAGRRVLRDAAQRHRVQPHGAAVRRRVDDGRARLPRPARGARRRLAAARRRRAQLRPQGQPRLGHPAALLHRVPHARHPEDLFPAAAAGRHRGVLQRARHHAGGLGRHHAAGRGRGPLRPPAHVRLAGLGPGHVLRGHSAGPQHGLQRAPLRRPAALREELHHLLRHLLRADGRCADHRHADPIQVRVRGRGDAGAGAACRAHARGALAAAARGAAAAARPRHQRAATGRAAAARARQGVRADDARDAGVGDRAAPVPEREGSLLPVRRLVHGIRHRPHLHLPILAPAGHRGLADAVRRGVRHQPHLRDLRVLLQLQADHADGAREGAVPGAGRQRAAVPVHLVPVHAVVGAAVRVRAGRDARRRVGRLLLVHRARRAARAALLGAGRAAGPAPRAGPRLRRRAGRAGRGALRHHTHLRRLRPAVRRGAGRVRLHQLPRRRRRRRGTGRRRGGGRGGARRGRGRRAGAARRALQPAAARALLHAPRRPAELPPRPVRRHRAELRRRRQPGPRPAPLQPLPVGARACPPVDAPPAPPTGPWTVPTTIAFNLLLL